MYFKQNLGLGLVACFAMSLAEGKSLAKAEKKDAEYQWLEEVEGPAALDWVRQNNKRSLDRLHAYKDYGSFKAEALEILEAKDKIAYGQIVGPYVYNFWQDAEHVRGIWRRSDWDSYRKNEPKWEVVLDLDALAQKDGKSYVFGGYECLRPKYERCILTLSDGGSDASQLREFDLRTKTFVSDGFNLPASKSKVEWLDENTLVLADAAGLERQTDSGYPLQLGLWSRGTKPETVKPIFAGQKSDVSVSASVLHDGEQTHVILVRADTFFTAELSLLKDGRVIRLPLPSDVELKGIYRGQLLFSNRKAFAGFASGSLLAASLNDLAAGKVQPELIYAPSPSQALDGIAVGKDYIYMALIDQVRNLVYRIERSGQSWQKTQLPLDQAGTIQLLSVDEDSHRLLLSYEDFLTPNSLYALDGKTLDKTLIKQLPARFNAEGLIIRQEFANSRDGTKVPYFLIHRKNLNLDGKNPTLLYGYGGFEVAMQPSYLAVAGRLWLERGGVYVLANIRGGGEFGPAWHQAALKENRQRAYDDFAAVAQRLIADKLTSARHLGIQGGSNGGLLMGVLLTQHPELFNAVLCQVPLLDMQRFHKLLAGASWMAEYGNPDEPSQASYILKYSPFHNLSAKKTYPEVFFMTSTKDDRVHPAHARKMAARMADMKHPFLYFENIEGGHSASANLQQTAERQALSYSYLWDKLGSNQPVKKSAGH